MRVLLGLTPIVSLLVAAPFAQAVITVTGYDDARHDRFYSGLDKDFIADDYNLSSVGNTAGSPGNGQWGTLVADSFIVSALHNAPAINSSVTFYPGNTTAGGVTYQVQQSWQIGGSDLWLGRINRPAGATDGISVMPIANLGVESNYDDAQIFNYGVPHRVGTNNVDLFGNVVVSGTPGRAFLFDDDETSDETQLQIGDSGAPTFIDIQGQAALLGIHWFIYDANDPPDGNLDGSGDTYVPFYAALLDAQIQASMPGQSLTFLPVPEPSSALLLVGAFGIMMSRRRR